MIHCSLCSRCSTLRIFLVKYRKTATYHQGSFNNDNQYIQFLSIFKHFSYPNFLKFLYAFWGAQLHNMASNFIFSSKPKKKKKKERQHPKIDSDSSLSALWADNFEQQGKPMGCICNTVSVNEEIQSSCYLHLRNGKSDEDYEPEKHSQQPIPPSSWLDVRCSRCKSK